MKTKLKDYCIKTKILIKEWREKYKNGCVYEQPFKCYSADIQHSTEGIASGGFKNKKELLKFIGDNL